MGTSVFSVFSSILGFIAAVTSLCTLIINICRSHLPSYRIKELEFLMNETEALFKRAVEDGLLTEPGVVQHIEGYLTILRTFTYRLQSRAHNATTLHQNLLEFFRGTSQSMESACQTLRDLRAHIVIYSEKRLGGLAVINSVLPALPLTPDPEYHSTPVLTAQIARPRSCPPLPPGWRFDLARHGFAEGNPSWDDMRGGSDIRATDAQICTSITHTSVTLEPGAGV